MKNKQKKIQTESVRVPIELMEKMRALARSNRRTFTAEMTLAMEQYLKFNG